MVGEPQEDSCDLCWSHCRDWAWTCGEVTLWAGRIKANSLKSKDPGENVPEGAAAAVAHSTLCPAHAKDNVEMAITWPACLGADV